MPREKHRGLRERPLEVDVAHLGAAGAEHLAPGLLPALHELGVRGTLRINAPEPAALVDGARRGSARDVGRTETRCTATALHLGVPTVLVDGPYRFFFYSADRHEPRHVHVERDTKRAKFWLDPVRLARSGGFSAAELREIERLVVERAPFLVEKWDEYFNIAD